MPKKFIVIVSVFLLILVGCGSNKSVEGNTTDTTNQEETTSQEEATNQEETNQEETNQEETNQEETNQEETNQEETNQEETNQEETNQEETNQEEATNQKEEATDQDDLCFKAVQNLRDGLGYSNESNIGYAAFDQNDGSYIIKLTILADNHGSAQGGSQAAGIYRIKDSGEYMEYKGVEIGGTNCYSGTGE